MGTVVKLRQASMDLDTHEEYARHDDARMSPENELYDDYLSFWMELEDEDVAFERVSDILDSATDEEYDAVARAYAVPGERAQRTQNVSVNTRSVASPRESPSHVANRRPMAGGARATNAVDAAHDYFALVDSLHDFDDIPYEGRPANTGRIPADVIRRALGDPVLPVGMEDIDDSRCPLRFGSKMTKSLPYLRFGPGMDMPNPLHGNDLSADIDIPHTFEGRHAVTSETAAAVLETQQQFTRSRYASKITPAAVVCEYDPDSKKRKVLEIQQVAAVCCAMKYKYGYHATFVVDNSDEHLLRLFTATIVMDRVFAKKFALSSRTDFVKALKHAMGPAWYDVAMCDANMLDSDNRGAFVRTQETGDVFRRGAETRVTLGGVSEDRKKFKLSLNGERYGVETIPFVEGSKVSVYTKYVDRKRHGNDYIADALATKRAADYGQIQHCAKYAALENKTFVFVTSDVIAAYYAIFRGVPVMNFRTRAYSDGDLQPLFCKVNVNLFAVEPAMPEFRMLVAPHAGGGRGAWAVCWLCVAVLVASVLT